MADPRETELGDLRADRLSGEILLEWLPVVQAPSLRQTFRLAARKPGVIEHDRGLISVFDQVEFRDRIDPRRPVGYSPALDDPLIRDKLQMASDDAASKQREAVTGRPADLGRWRISYYAERRHLRELHCVGEGCVDALGSGLDRDLLVNRFRCAGDVPGGPYSNRHGG